MAREFLKSVRLSEPRLMRNLGGVRMLAGKGAVRRAIVVGLAVATGIGATCGAASAKTKISFMAWVTQKADSDCFNRVVKGFMKEHPDIEVKFIGEAWSGEIPYFSKYLAMTTAGVAPDVINIPYNYVPNFAESNILEDLGPYVKRSKFDLTAYNPAGVAASSWKGKLWGLNAGTGGDFWVFYNKKLIAESGSVDPGTLMAKGDWNWLTMESIMAKTSKFDGQKLVRIGYNQMADVSAVSPWIYGMGGRLMDADGLKCTFNEQPAIDAIAHIRDGMYTKRIMGLSWAPPYNLDHSSAGKAQKYAMLGWWNTMGTFLVSNKMPWQVDMVPFPKGPVEAKDNVTTIHSVCISRQSKQKAAAWELIQYLGGPRGQLMFAEDLQGMPTRKDLVKRFGEIYKEQGFSGGQFVQDAMDRLHPMERATKYNLAQPKMNEALSKIWAGKSDVAQAMKDAARVATVELARGAKKK